MTLHERSDHSTTYVLIDPTSPDGESALDLLDDDEHISLVVLTSGRMSSALREFAHSDDIDVATAGWIYLDQVAERIADGTRIIEAVLASGPDPADELEQLAALSSTRRILVPTSLLRLDLGAYRRLADRSDLEVEVPTLEPSR